MQDASIETVEIKPITDLCSENPVGKIIIKYLQDSKNGATVSQIVKHLTTSSKVIQNDELKRDVEMVIESGMNLGILKKLKPEDLACEACCFRRRRRRSCGRRRKCCCRRRRRRKCRRRKRRCRR